MAEGPKVVGELIAGRRFECKQVFATREWISQAGNDLLSACKGKLTEVETFELEKIALLSSPNQVVGEFHKKTDFDKPDLTGKLTLMLDDISDPGNFGTIIRTADWFGITNLVCSPGTVDMYNPKVVQSTMASLGNVNILYSDLDKFLVKHKNIRTYAATLGGSLLQPRQITEGILIIGNESKGISKVLSDRADYQVAIPGFGNAESLNAAVAAGIILYAMTAGSSTN